MHEMTIAMNIVDIVCKQANDENAHKINSVDIEIGELSGVLIDSLEFCFEAASKNTIADGADLNIHTIKAEAFCKTCNNSFNIESEFSSCPTCENYNFELKKGKELLIKSFNID